MAAPLTREQADHALAALREAYDRIATAMYALDSHSELGFLRGRGLTGTTAKVAGDVDGLLRMLWAQFAALQEPLDRATQVRAARSRPGAEELVALTALLAEPVVGLGRDGFPAQDATASRVTLTALAQDLEASTAQLAQLLTEVGSAVSAAAGRLARLTDALGEVQALAGSFPGVLDVAGLARQLDEARALALADPIEVARGGAAGAAVERHLSQLGTELAAARVRFDELVRARDEFPRRLAALRDAIEAVAAAQAEAARSYEVVRVKIANPGLPGVPADAAALRDQLSKLEQSEVDWVRRAGELSRLEQESERARALAVRLREAADGLMDRRAELRGRLDAYRAKAARLGHGEHQRLSEAHRAAHDILYTSPCDLPAATRAVFRYQQELADLEGRTP